MNFKFKKISGIIVAACLATGSSAVLAHNDQGDKSKTPTVFFSTHPAMKESKSLSALTATMEVQDMTTDAPSWYWAFQGDYMSEGGFYFGLQPAGQYGKTALFSIFGKGTQSNFKWCKPGADSGNEDTGTSCHIPYTWEIGHKYTFNVKLTGSDSDKGLATWQGSITDRTTGEETTIGIISVPSRWSGLQPSVLGWAEWFSHGELSCAQRTNFAVRYSDVSGIYSDTNATWKSYVSDSTPNTCATYDTTGTYPTSVVMNAGGTFDKPEPPSPEKPVAVVGEGFTVTGTTDHSQAYDLDGSSSKNAAAYRWTILNKTGDFWLQEKHAGPWVSVVELQKARALIPANTYGQVTYQLVVTDKNGVRSEPATLTVKVNKADPSSKNQAFVDGLTLAMQPSDQGDSVIFSGGVTSSATATSTPAYLWVLPAEALGGSNGNGQARQRFTVNKTSQPQNLKVKVRVTAGQASRDLTQDIRVEAKGGTGAVPAYDARKTYSEKCTRVLHNGKVWQNQWYLNAGQEEPGKGGAWGAWREVGASENTCP